MAMDNYQRFYETMTGCLVVLFADDPWYAQAASMMTPAEMARKMTNGLAAGTASKDGESVRQTCRTLGIPHTYKAIREYLEVRS